MIYTLIGNVFSVADSCVILVKKKHLKVQTSVQHEIVNIKSSGDVGGQPTIRTDNIPCQIHTKKLHCMFCRNCDTLVCPDCISKSHRKHDLECIDQVCLEMKEKLGTSKNHIAKNLAICEFETERFRDTEASRDFVYAYALEKIKKREQKLKDDISKYALELRQKIEKEKEQTNITLSEIGKLIKVEENTLNEKQNEIQMALESDQAGQIFTTASEFRDYIPHLSFKTLPNSILDFCPGELSKQQVSNLFGLLKPIQTPEEKFHFTLETQKIYTTDLPSVNRFLLQYNEKAWISSSSADVLRQVMIDNLVKNIKEIPVKIVDITLNSRNDVLLASNDSSDVIHVTKSRKLEHFISVSPLLGKGIYATKDDDIILGVREKGDPYKVTKKSCRKIIIFGSNRQVKCSYEYDKNNQRLFIVPWRITTNVNNDIVVIDAISKNTGRVVVLGKEGDLKWVYKGHPTINAGENHFNPKDVVTSVGHIVVADCTNHALHVVSGEGDVIICKVMKEQGIIFPQSLDIDSKGQLWVGCDTYKGEKDAKIHVLKLY